MKTERMELWPGGPVFRQAAHAPLGTDSVLLADFAAGKAARGIDLGCGSGILMLLLLSGAPQLEMTGLELREDAALIARENLAANGLAARGGRPGLTIEPVLYLSDAEGRETEELRRIYHR